MPRMVAGMFFHSSPGEALEMRRDELADLVENDRPRPSRRSAPRFRLNDLAPRRQLRNGQAGRIIRPNEAHPHDFAHLPADPCCAQPASRTCESIGLEIAFGSLRQQARRLDGSRICCVKVPPGQFHNSGSRHLTGSSIRSINIFDEGTTDPTMTGCFRKPRRKCRKGPPPAVRVKRRSL